MLLHAFSLILAIGTPPVDARAKAIAAIRRADAAWVKAAATHRASAWCAFYSPDAAMMPPHEPLCTTPAQRMKSMAAFLSLPELVITWKPTKVEAARSGEVGYSWGTYSATWLGSDKRMVRDHGKNVEVWRRQRNLEVRGGFLELRHFA